MHINRYKVHGSQMINIELSKNPLDDYQRLYFLTLFTDASRKLTDQLKLQPIYVEYKSSFAHIFLNTKQYVNYKKTKPQRGLIASSGTIENDTESPNVLPCFEYQLPNIQFNSNSSNNIIYDLSEYQWNCLGLTDDNLNMLLKGDILPIEYFNMYPKNDLSAVHSNSESHRNSVISTSRCRKRRRSKKIGSELKSANNSSTSLLSSDSDSETSTNNYLLNENNYIVWSRDSGHVFFTGIWRLYQDIMRGLSNCSRYNVKNNTSTESNEILQQRCKDEFKFIIEKAFKGDEIANTESDFKKTRGRKRKNPFTSDQILSDFTTCVGSTYIDFPWNKLSASFQEYLVEEYKKSIRGDDIPTQNELDDITFDDLIRRIRGGYVKIQGTWLPMEISRILCLRFCFPIRYFLAPIFGESFPQECAAIYDHLSGNEFSRNNTNFRNQSSNNIGPVLFNEVPMNSQTGMYSNIDYPVPNQHKVEKKLNNISKVKKERILPKHLAPSKISALQASINDIPLFNKFYRIVERKKSSIIPSLVLTNDRPHSLSWTSSSTKFEHFNKISNEILPPINTIINSINSKDYIFASIPVSTLKYDYSSNNSGFLQDKFSADSTQTYSKLEKYFETSYSNGQLASNQFGSCLQTHNKNSTIIQNNLLSRAPKVHLIENSNMPYA